MDNRKLYNVVIGGIKHEMLLDEHDAKRYGDRATVVGSDPNPLQPVDSQAVQDEVVVDDELDDEEDPDDEDLEEPAGNASREQWEAYARDQGATDEDIDGMSRDDLRATYGS